MTETEARKQYKREWARRNRAKMKESENRFYEKKAAEYAEASEPASEQEKEIDAMKKEMRRLNLLIEAQRKKLRDMRAKEEEREKAILAKIAEYEEMLILPQAKVYEFYGIK